MNKKSLFSWTRVICLVVATLALVAYAMTVDTLTKMQTQYITYAVATDEAATPFVKTAMVADTGQELVVALTPVKSIYLNGQFAPAAVAEVPEPYNFIYVGVSIKGKGNLAGMDTINTYTCKTIMVENQGGMGGIAPQLATTQKKLTI